MAVKIELDEVYKLFNIVQRYENGWVNIKELIVKIAFKYNCSELTARNFLIRNKQNFEFRYGGVRIREDHISTVSDQKTEQAEFDTWMKERTDILDECVQYLSTQDMSPILEAILVQISHAREELKSYNSSRFENILMDIRREYEFVPTKQATLQ